MRRTPTDDAELEAHLGRTAHVALDVLRAVRLGQNGAAPCEQSEPGLEIRVVGRTRPGLARGRTCKEQSVPLGIQEELSVLRDVPHQGAGVPVATRTEGGVREGLRHDDTVTQGGVTQRHQHAVTTQELS